MVKTCERCGLACDADDLVTCPECAEELCLENCAPCGIGVPCLDCEESQPEAA